MIETKLIEVRMYRLRVSCVAMRVVGTESAEVFFGKLTGDRLFSRPSMWWNSELMFDAHTELIRNWAQYSSGAIMQAGTRRCLKCNKEFKSCDVRRNRICSSCNKDNSKLRVKSETQASGRRQLGDNE